MNEFPSSSSIGNRHGFVPDYCQVAPCPPLPRASDQPSVFKPFRPLVEGDISDVIEQIVAYRDCPFSADELIELVDKASQVAPPCDQRYLALLLLTAVRLGGIPSYEGQSEYPRFFEAIELAFDGTATRRVHQFNGFFVAEGDSGGSGTKKALSTVRTIKRSTTQINSQGGSVTTKPPTLERGVFTTRTNPWFGLKDNRLRSGQAMADFIVERRLIRGTRASTNNQVANAFRLREATQEFLDILIQATRLVMVGSKEEVVNDLIAKLRETVKVVPKVERSKQRSKSDRQVTPIIEEARGTAPLLKEASPQPVTVSQSEPVGFGLDSAAEDQVPTLSNEPDVSLGNGELLALETPEPEASSWFALPENQLRTPEALARYAIEISGEKHLNQQRIVDNIREWVETGVMTYLMLERCIYAVRVKHGPNSPEATFLVEALKKCVKTR